MKVHKSDFKSTINSKLKISLIYITLTTVAIVSWLQLAQLSDDQNSLTTTLPLFTTDEVDPATWPIQIKEKEAVYSQRSIFPHDIFSKKNERGYPPVTAIISRIDNTDAGIIHAIKHLVKYPFIKEIYVYNRVKNRPIANTLFSNITESIRETVRIEVIETDTYDLGKFTACAAASYERCYFQDDLWLNPFLDSLYTHSQRYPDHLVVNARPVNYIDYKKWRFQNKDISLHTGYTDLRYGAFVLREKAQNFLDQTSLQGFDASKFQNAGVYFSIWLNQYPYIVYNPLLSNGREKFRDADTVNNREDIEYHMYDALSLLEASLGSSQDTLDPFDKGDLPPNEWERDVRSSCSNDRCLFVTNMDAMPHVDNLEFSSVTSLNMSEFNVIYNHTNPSLPSSGFFSQYSYHKAVDQNMESCWDSYKPPRVDDYFGLYMTGDIRAKRVTLYTPTIFDKPLNLILKVTVQFRLYDSWEDCNLITNNKNYSESNRRIGFYIECPRQTESFKSIRITYREDQKVPFKLCGFALDNFLV